MSKAEGREPAKHAPKPETALVTGGRKPFAHHGYINTPVYRAATITYPTAEDFLAQRGPYAYGRIATPTSEALEQAIQTVEGPACAGVALLPSGLAAISTALLSVLRAGDHVLVIDSCYGPAREFCDTVLARYGIETTYYDPLAGSSITALMRPNTRAVYTEAPGSLTFEMPDIPAIADAAHRGGALVLMDNTWAGPLHFRPLEHGVDLAIQSGSKYIGGHCDLMLGTVSANTAALAPLKHTVLALGLCAGPDDMTLALRGLRTLGVRLTRHFQSGLRIAQWLQARPEVLRVLHPALPDDPGHAIWRRDFSGGCGLFGVVFKPVTDLAVHAFLNALTLFGIGASWGGYESLAIPYDASTVRTATRWAPGGPCVRFHVGLEDPDDLIADLERGFAALSAAR